MAFLELEKERAILLDRPVRESLKIVEAPSKLY